MGLDDMKWIIRIEDIMDLDYWDEIYTDDLEAWVISRDFEKRKEQRPGLVIKWIQKID